MIFQSLFRYGRGGCFQKLGLDADDLGDGVGSEGSGSGDAVSVLDELGAGVPQAVAVEVVGLALQPAAQERRGAALKPAQTPAELGLEALQKIFSLIILSNGNFSELRVSKIVFSRTDLHNLMGPGAP